MAPGVADKAGGNYLHFTQHGQVSSFRHLEGVGVGRGLVQPAQKEGVENPERLYFCLNHRGSHLRAGGAKLLNDHLMERSQQHPF